MAYKCEVLGLELDDCSAEDVFYCGVVNQKKICVNCDNSRYEGITFVNIANTGNETLFNWH